MLVEVAGLPGATESKTSDLTAMRDFELRDEFSGLVARRFVALTTCGDECCKSKGPVEKVRMVFWFSSWLMGVIGLIANAGVVLVE